MKKLIVLVMILCGIQYVYAQTPKGYKLTVIAEGNFGTPNGDVFNVIKGGGSAVVFGPLYQNANESLGIDVLQDFDFFGTVAVLCGKGVDPVKLAVVNYPEMDTLFTVNSGLGAGIQRCGLYDESKAFLFPATGSILKAVDIETQEISDVSDPDGHLSGGVHSMVRFHGHMYTANGSKVMKIDPETNTAVGSILPGLTNMNTMVRDDSNDCLWLLGKSGSYSAIVKINADDVAEEPVIITGITNAKLLRVGPDRLYFVSGLSFYIYDLTTGEIPESPVYSSTFSGSSFSVMYDRSFTVDPLSGDFAYSSAGGFSAPGFYEIVDGTTFTRIDSGAVTGAAIPNELYLTTWLLDTWDTMALPVVTAECETELTVPVAYFEGTAISGTTENSIIAELGTHEITWVYTYEDESITQVQTVVIEDTEAPVPQMTSLPALTGQCPYVPEEPKADDNCMGEISGVADVTIFEEPGTYLITWTYTDAAGNYVIQEQSLTVECEPSGIEDMGGLSVKIYPNPAHDYVRIELAEQGHYRIVLSDILGKEVSRQDIQSDSADLDVQSLPGGVYHLSISDDLGQRMIHRLVIMK